MQSRHRLDTLEDFIALSEPMSVIRLFLGSKVLLSADWFRGFVWWGKLMTFGGVNGFRTRIWDCDGRVLRRKFCNNTKAWDNWLSTVVSGRSSAEYIVLDEALGWECGE